MALAEDLPTSVAAAAPLFPTMGPDGRASQLGAQIAVTSGDGTDGESIKRLDLVGQWMSPSGLGAYGTFAASAYNGETSLGSLELGAVWSRPRDNADLVFRAGVVLPTARDTEDESAFVHMIGTLLARPSDYLVALPETTTLRVAFAPSVRNGDFVARADLGLDLVLDTGLGENPDAPFLHVDLGAGYHNGKVGALVEVSTFAYLEETEELAHLVAFTGELTTGRATPYFTLSRPFGGVVDETDVTNLVLGLRGDL